LTAVETSHTAVEQRILSEAIPERAVVLEAGCGRTTRLSEHRDRIARLVGIDMDTAAGRENPTLDEFVEADLSKPLPFDDGTFDLVYSNFVVEHLEDPAATFREFRRVLRPDGWLVILTSNRSNPLMAAARAMPQSLRVLVKRRGAGAADRDVFPARYRANTPAALEAATLAAGLTPSSVEYVATLHRYGARIPGAASTLRLAERALSEHRRSTIVAAYRPTVQR
jgi:SAM-dependent methyltransferase